jgi:hypothetical protein
MATWFKSVGIRLGKRARRTQKRVAYPERMSLDLPPAPLRTDAVEADASVPGPRSDIRRPGAGSLGAVSLGAGSFGAALLLAVVEAIAIALGSDQHFVAATILAWFVIVLTVASFIAGLVAVVSGRGRRVGIAAMVLSVLANPLVLVWLLGALGSLLAGR